MEGICEDLESSGKRPFALPRITLLFLFESKDIPKPFTSSHSHSTLTTNYDYLQTCNVMVSLPQLLSFCRRMIEGKYNYITSCVALTNVTRCRRLLATLWVPWAFPVPLPSAVNMEYKELLRKFLCKVLLAYLWLIGAQVPSVDSKKPTYRHIYQTYQNNPTFKLKHLKKTSEIVWSSVSRKRL